MKIFKYLKSLIIALKYRFCIEEILCARFPNIVFIKGIKGYIVFCPRCGEYVCDDGTCSNPFCPERIEN